MMILVLTCTIPTKSLNVSTVITAYICMYKVNRKKFFFLLCLLFMFNHCIICFVNHLQKLVERRKAFEKAKFQNEEEKAKWSKVITLDLMSSEESGNDGDEEVLIHHPIPWISSTGKTFKRKLDEASLKGKSPQSKRQKKTRVGGPMSTRSLPNEYDKFPSWIFMK